MSSRPTLPRRASSPVSPARSGQVSTRPMSRILRSAEPPPANAGSSAMAPCSSSDDEHRARVGDLDEPVGQVDDRPVVVAFPGDAPTRTRARPRASGSTASSTGPLGEPQRDLQRRRSGLSDTNITSSPIVFTIRPPCSRDRVVGRAPRTGRRARRARRPRAPGSARCSRRGRGSRPRASAPRRVDVVDGELAPHRVAHLEPQHVVEDARAATPSRGSRCRRAAIVSSSSPASRAAATESTIESLSASATRAKPAARRAHLLHERVDRVASTSLRRMNHASTARCSVRSTSTDSSVKTGTPSGMSGNPSARQSRARHLGVDPGTLGDVLAVVVSRASRNSERSIASSVSQPSASAWRDLLGGRAAVEQERARGSGSTT